MIRKTEYLCVFLTGGVIYTCLELFWRGYTHWSMTLAGGICLLGLYCMNRKMHARHLLLRCLAGTGLITAVEFSVGIVVNRILQLGVWDYSAMPGNILGQICPAFSVMWFFICMPAFLLSGAFSRFFAWLEKREKMPQAAAQQP